jgi:transcriptional regulator with GAF, ATPase, and Fis domain
MVDYSNSGKDFEIPVDIMEKWQRMVNIMSKLLRVPTGFIMKVNAPHIQIFTTNVADTNPYHAGQNFELADLYCEEVMKSDNLLLVPDALKDPEWNNNPEIPAGFIYYLGYPVHWPTGKLFGTICVQDYENNLHATDNKDLLKEFRSVCELDLLMVKMHMNLESIVAERTLSLRMSEERSGRAVEERLRFQELISRISTKFIGLSGIEFEQAIQDALAEIGRYFKSDTVRLYRLSLQGDVLKIRNMWRDENLSPPEEMVEIHKMKYPNLAAHYSKGEATVFSKYDDSPQWPEMRKILKFFGTKAGVGVPLEVDDSGVDVFAMDIVQSEHVWPKNIVEQSKAIGNIILSAMRRREAEIELQNSYDEIKQLKDQLETDNIYLQDEIKLNHNFEEIIGESKDLQYALHRVEKISPSNTTVLILGETGTGKELVARAIHNASPLKNRTVIKVNCAVLPKNLIESELFGHEKGAFTGAYAKQIGRFERANGTSLFLDEICELPVELQPKLLRVLQEGEFERLGGSETINVNVRVITATNRNLEEEVREGRFRQDLYYRINVFPITVPPLRNRKEDIPLLVKFLVQKICRKLGKQITNIPQKTIATLQEYSWPGNIRELENVIEGAVITSPGETLNIELPETSILVTNNGVTLEEVEREHILNILKLKNWRIEGPKGAALVLGMNPGTLRSRMQNLGIVKPKLEM